MTFQSDTDLYLKVLEEATVKMQCTLPGRVQPSFDPRSLLHHPDQRKGLELVQVNLNWEGQWVGEACKEMRER